MAAAQEVRSRGGPDLGLDGKLSRACHLWSLHALHK